MKKNSLEMEVSMINCPKLNLASGQIRIPGFLNIDKVFAKNVDAVMNLEDYPWPIESDSAEEIVCNHYIEHIPMDGYGRQLIKLIQSSASWEDFQSQVQNINLDAPSDGLILFMEEVYRILKVNGVIHLDTPYYHGGVAWQDPTHRRCITEVTYDYFNRAWRNSSNLSHYGINCNFDVIIKGFDMYADMNFETEMDKKFAIRAYGNMVFALKVSLYKKP